MGSSSVVPGPKIERLQKALIEAFPTRHALAQMVRIGLDENLGAIAKLGDLTSETFDLITWAEAHGRLPDLIRAALKANPGNHLLRASAEELGVEVPAARPQVRAHPDPYGERAGQAHPRRARDQRVLQLGYVLFLLFALATVWIVAWAHQVDAPPPAQSAAPTVVLTSASAMPMPSAAVSVPSATPSGQGHRLVGKDAGEPIRDRSLEDSGSRAPPPTPPPPPSPASGPRAICGSGCQIVQAGWVGSPPPPCVWGQWASACELGEIDSTPGVEARRCKPKPEPRQQPCPR